MESQALQAIQDRLLTKREELKATGNLTQWTSSVDDFIHYVPDCIHGNKLGFCEECKKYPVGRLTWEEELAAEMDEKYKNLVDNREERIRKWLLFYGVPNRYIEASLENYKGNNNVVNACRSSVGDDGIMLSGNTGCGKTHLAIAMLRQVVDEKLTPLRLPGQPPVNKSPIRAEFITVPKLLLNLRASFGGKGKISSHNGDEIDASESEIIDHYSCCDFLVLDDLGAEKTTDFALSSLYILIDNRVNELRPTIVTTNLSLAEIEAKMDGRIASRLSGMKIISISMPDYRKKR